MLPKDLTDQELRRQYLEELVSIKDLAKKYHVSDACVRRHLLKVGTKLRNKSEVQAVPSYKTAFSTKQKEIQNRPEVKAKKAKSQHKAMTSEATKQRHRNGILKTFKEGRKVWNKGLTKDADKRVGANAEATQKTIQDMWDSGYYYDAILNGKFKTAEKTKKKISKACHDGLSFKRVKTRYGIQHLNNNDAIKTIKKNIEEDLNKEGYVLIDEIQNIHTKSYIKCKCPNGHEWRVQINGWRTGSRCRICSNNLSKQENIIFNFCKELFPNTIQGYRPVWLNGKEIDVFIPDKNLGIEYCGLYWHSTKYKDKYYHRDKYLACKVNGVKLLTIFSDEWESNPELIRAMIRHRCGIFKDKIRASKCTVTMITDNKILKGFLDKFHLAGHVNASLSLGLYHKDKLVSLLTFRRPYTKHKAGVIEIARFASDHDYIIYGGFTKLLKHFIEHHSQEYGAILSYSDCRIGHGTTYGSAGFNFIKHNSPNYWYTDGVKREFRFKHRLNHELFYLGSTEVEQTQAQGLYPIYDCGHYRWELPLP